MASKKEALWGQHVHVAGCTKTKLLLILDKNWIN